MITGESIPLAGDSQGRIHVLDTYNHRVQRIIL